MSAFDGKLDLPRRGTALISNRTSTWPRELIHRFRIRPSTAPSSAASPSSRQAASISRANRLVSQAGVPLLRHHAWKSVSRSATLLRPLGVGWQSKPGLSRQPRSGRCPFGHRCRPRRTARASRETTHEIEESRTFHTSGPPDEERRPDERAIKQLASSGSR
jgi:hypothetical protein